MIGAYTMREGRLHGCHESCGSRQPTPARPAAWASSSTGRELATGRTLEDYDRALAWSIEEPGQFWSSLAEFAEIRWHETASIPVEHLAMPGTRWFPGATVSYSEHALRDGLGRGRDVAIVSRSQTRDPEEWTWDRLSREVGSLRSWLRQVGVRAGDRVAAYLPNLPETIAGFLATASLGAIWVSCAPEFGVRSVVDRLGQLGPKVLMTVDGYRYGATAIDRRAEVEAIRRALPSLEAILHLPYLDERPLPGALRWHEVREATGEPVEHEPVAFDHPLYVLFSSGTTGLPKPIVHGTGGILLEHWKALALHHDLGRDDRFFWFTTTGWMMWNLLVSGLLVGATLLCFDGNPRHPDLTTLWRLAAESGCTLFGASAPFLMACRKEGLRPSRLGPLQQVRQVGSTGAPLPPEGFRWVADELPGVQVNSTSGGTDVCTAFVGTNPLVPVWEGEISRPLLGCDVAAWSDRGGEVPVGTEGELVLRTPIPSMPVGLWGDEDGSRLRATYFDRFPGLWSHGDWIRFTERGSCVISGRSDATLNRGGVRIGTSELYSVVEGFPEVTDSLVVHLDEDDTLVLFLVLAPGCAASSDERLDEEIRRAIRTELSPRHVPDRIETVADVPRTLSGKKLEVPVKRILEGAPLEDVVSRGALSNPESLSEFVGRSRRA